MAMDWISFQPAELQSPVHLPLEQHGTTALLWG